MRLEAPLGRPEALVICIPWRQVIGMCDKLTHDYMGVDLDGVWKKQQSRIWLRSSSGHDLRQLI